MSSSLHRLTRTRRAFWPRYRVCTTCPAVSPQFPASCLPRWSGREAAASRSLLVRMGALQRRNARAGPAGDNVSARCHLLDEPARRHTVVAAQS